MGREAILALVAELVMLNPGLAAKMIKGNANWLAASTGRPKPWEQWSPEQKNAFRSLLDQLLPFQPTALAAAPFPYAADQPPDQAAIATTYHAGSGSGGRAATDPSAPA